MNSQFCVVGNGLLGAAIALELSKKTNKVCLIGARYGDENQFYSGHEDDSRMVRQFHNDPYWENLTKRNMSQLDELMASTGLPIFHKLPVLYRFPVNAAPNSPLLRHLHEITPHQFTHEDAYGGLLNPKMYIEALNKAAKKNGANIYQAIVHSINRRSNGFHVQTHDACIKATHVVDARGIHSPDIADQLSVVGKICLFTRSPTQTASAPYCFIDTSINSTHFRDVYGFYRYRHHAGTATSKFGFSECLPIRLQTNIEVVEWFRGAYLQHPLLAEARDWINHFFNDATTITDIKPCAFTVTLDGKPHITLNNGLLTVTGCNGMVAKCCQALAQDAVTFFHR